MTAIKNLIKESIAAGFYNIDIDASTMVDMSKTDLVDQQEANGRLTAELTKYIRSVEPKGVTISVGGEIGEIGHTNSTVEDLRAYMQQYRKNLPTGMKGISKISVQTGTTHGGIVLPGWFHRQSTARLRYPGETFQIGQRGIRHGRCSPARCFHPAR